VDLRPGQRSPCGGHLSCWHARMKRTVGHSREAAGLSLPCPALPYRPSVSFGFAEVSGGMRCCGFLPPECGCFLKFPQRSAVYYVLLNVFNYMYGVVFQRAVCVVFQRAVCVVFQRNCKRPCVVFQRKINRLKSTNVWCFSGLFWRCVVFQRG
jgi:hypothetical protein